MTVSDWTWTDGAPPGPQTARAGETWTLRLPLEGTGDSPAIEWKELPDGLQVRPSPLGSLVFDFEVAVSLGGSTHELKYRRGDNQLLDRLWLKILPAGEVLPDPLKAEPAGPIPDAIAQIPGSITDTTTHQDGIINGTDPDRPGNGPALAQEARQEETPNRAGTPLDPQLEYVVQVYRGATALLQLTRPLRIDRSLLVGKLASLKHGISLPDIDLRHHFADAQAAAQCSRQQAKVFWSQGHIYLLNTGENPIILPDASHLKSGQDYSWQLGEELTLPGGLRLRLALGTY
jgi:hypothetical protein